MWAFLAHRPDMAPSGVRGNTVEYPVRDGTLECRWADVVPGFDMPVKATLDWPAMA
jgi:hypothetical protein